MTLTAVQQRLESRLTEALASPSGGLPTPLRCAVLGSDFFLQWVERNPDLFTELHRAGYFEHRLDAQEVASELNDTLPVSIPDDSEVADAAAFDRWHKAAMPDLMGVVRVLRNREMARMIWREVNGLADLKETVASVTALAEVTLQAVLERLHQWHVRQYGTPRDAQGAPQELVVFAMGKLGAGELNLSSDIDLMLAYRSGGQVDGPRQMTNEAFFTRVAQVLIKALDEITVDGFVFRVDLRLRPYGKAGPLAVSMAQMEDYYEQQGRDWERYALIKARPVAGDIVVGDELLASLRPFVYRRYLDFGAIDALREMKTSINRERRGARYAQDVKTGPGGIREVEFIAQAHQLIHGGREIALRERSIFRIMPALADLGHLPVEVVDDLLDAYGFLRTVEHRLQAFRDQQTHSLPADEEDRYRLAITLATGGGDPDFDASGPELWSALQARIDDARARIQQQFDAFIDDPETGGDVDSDPLLPRYAEIWAEPEEDWTATLASLDFADTQASLNLLRDLRRERRTDVRQEVGRGRLDRLMPLLLSAVVAQDDKDEALRRSLGFVEAVLRRTAYLVLLAENPKALLRFVDLVSHSTYISEELVRSPALLDELLDDRALSVLPDQAELKQLLHQQLVRVPSDDLERQMDLLREFRAAHAFRVACCELQGVLPLMRVSDALTDLAEAVCDEVVELVWQHQVQRHGVPEGVSGEPGVVVIGYGKLGGIELGPGSDLDVVFLHDAATAGQTTGQAPTPDDDRSASEPCKPVANGMFYARLGQRIVHMISTQTPAGRLYELDLRLRPSGRSGPLVSAFEAWQSYLMERAWTFEHQALVRARPVAGPPSMRARFSAIREEILSQKRDPDELRENILSMRARMRDQKRTADDPENIDVKQARGGIVDIEFMVQYLVLRWAHDHPSLLQYTDNVRILECAAEVGLLSEQVVATLQGAYLELRTEAHRCVLASERQADGRAQRLQDTRDAVARVWDTIFAETS